MDNRALKFALFICFSVVIFYLFWSVKQSRQDFFNNIKLIDTRNIESVVFKVRGKEFELLPKYFDEFAGCFSEVEVGNIRVGGEVAELRIYLKSKGIFYAQLGLVHDRELVKFGGLPMKFIWPEKNINIGRGGFMGASDCLYLYFKQGLNLRD
ncbi:hypothetical protein ACJJIW_16065 [Microbulbifer sp. JMSA004]|uniref:hypothetical protein n=1 Tax=unclassified Microbulbifer TaxID=2619833 RepID=UPI00403B18E7